MCEYRNEENQNQVLEIENWTKSNRSWKIQTDSALSVCIIKWQKAAYKTIYNKKLIRRWGSKRELFYNDIVYVEASTYAHWTIFLISTK